MVDCTRLWRWSKCYRMVGRATGLVTSSDEAHARYGWAISAFHDEAVEGVKDVKDDRFPYARSAKREGVRIPALEVFPLPRVLSEKTSSS